MVAACRSFRMDILPRVKVRSEAMGVLLVFAGILVHAKTVEQTTSTEQPVQVENKYKEEIPE